ncbi:protein kinase domain-containing protein [Prosthecobacter sp.]|uniref:bifunctional serine/threonine-protein kinase/formylglycine-generating enzyme family protein n=1 Tax=Prosthecobacter sp. TaxID=1965333 RepID=UPI0037837316
MSLPATPGEEDPTFHCDPDVIDEIFCRARIRAEGVRAEWHAPAVEVVAAMLEGKYDQITYLGRGGMAAVYSGRHIKLNIKVAIKLPGLRLRSEEDLERFRKEAHNLLALTDERIVRIYDYDEVGGVPYYSMELVAGRTLHESAPDLSAEQKLRVVISLCRVLAFVHSRGVIHRDVKPDNIMVLAEEKIKLMDFGIACMSDGLAGFTRLGTQDFQSPEQAFGTGVTHQSDIYSLGMTLWWLFTGQSRVRVFDPGAEEEFAAKVPPDVMADVKKACQLQPKDRFDDMKAMEGALERSLFQMQHPSLPGRTASPAPKAQPPPIPAAAPTAAAAPIPTAAPTATAPPVPVSAPPPQPKPRPQTQPQTQPQTRPQPKLSLWHRLKGSLSIERLSPQINWVQCFTWAAAIAVVAWNIGLTHALFLAAAVRVFLFTRVSLRLRQVGVGIVALAWMGWAFLPVSPSRAKADRPFVNSLGMSFVPLPGTQVLIAVRPTEARAYHKFVDEQSTFWDRSWLTYSNANSKTDPVRHISCKEAKAFVDWLSLREGLNYRLQTSQEWEQAVAPGGPIYGDAKTIYIPWEDYDDSTKPNRLGIEPIDLDDFEWCENSEVITAAPGNAQGFAAGSLHTYRWLRSGVFEPGGQAIVFRTSSLETDRNPLSAFIRALVVPKPPAKTTFTASTAKETKKSSVPEGVYSTRYTFRCVLDLRPPAQKSSSSATPGPDMISENKK